MKVQKMSKTLSVDAFLQETEEPNNRGLKKIPFSEFLKRAQAIWGDRFAYNEDSYTSMNGEVEIYCKKHDHTFTKLAFNHVNSKSPANCPKCSLEPRPNTSFEEYKEKALKVHNGRGYTYPYADYKGTSYPISYHCPKHGKQTCNNAQYHLKKEGFCPECKKDRKLKKFLTTLQERHEDNLTYVRGFVDSRTPVVMKCNNPNHPEFKIKPCNLFRGSGCKHRPRSKDKNESLYCQAPKENKDVQ